MEKRKKIEEELYEYITEARQKELKVEKDDFKTVIKNYKEGSTEYLSAVEKHNKNVLEINDKYNKEMAEATLALFKERLTQQPEELDERYKQRLETARAELYKETEANKEYYEFVSTELNKISKKEKEAAKEKRELLDSYFAAYQTIEEKIVSIHKKTAELLLLTDDEYEKERLKNIEEMLIAEIEASEATKEVDEKLAAFGEDLNNEELENKIATLELMKLEYVKYGNEVTKINKEIAEAQKQIWENIRSEIDSTASALHNLADIVGNFDTKLESTINNLGNLVSGVGAIVSGFAMGGIGGFAGILGGIATVISTIIDLFTTHHSDVPELKIELQAITLELQKQQTILSQSTGTARPEAIQNTIDLLKEQIATYNDMIAAEEAAYGQFLWWTWDETDQEAIEGYLAAIGTAEAAVASLNQQYREILTGTTAETIADAIAEGFSKGLDSAQVFADTFNDMMKKAIVDAFKRTIITQYLEKFIHGFSKLSEGGLTAAEINSIAFEYLRMLSSIETQWDTMQKILESVGIQLEDAVAELAEGDITGLTGAIAGITEETAGLLAGQFMAIRINTVGILNNMESIIIINSQIADNTKYCKYLEHISAKLDEMNSSSLRAIGG